MAVESRWSEAKANEYIGEEAEAQELKTPFSGSIGGWQDVARVLVELNAEHGLEFTPVEISFWNGARR